MGMAERRAERAGVFWRRRSTKVGPLHELGSRPPQGFPRGAAAADDDGRRLCGVRIYPTCSTCSRPANCLVVVHGALLPTSSNRRPATVSIGENMGPCCTQRHAQDLDSIRLRYVMPKCNSTIALVSTWDRSHREHM